MAPKKGKRRTMPKKTDDMGDDFVEEPKEKKTDAEKEQEREYNAKKQKIVDQYKKDLKDPEARCERERKMLVEYIQKKSKGGEVIMPLEDRDKLARQLWSPTSIFQIMEELGWSLVYEKNRDYFGFLLKQKKSKGK